MRPALVIIDMQKAYGTDPVTATSMRSAAERIMEQRSGRSPRRSGPSSPRNT